MRHERAQQVRHHEPDERNRPRHRHRAADGERGPGDELQPQAAEIEAEALGRILAERQTVERRPRYQQQPPIR
jgi:hypothetical protein